MNKRLIGILTVLAFVGSFLLANYFSDQRISVHAQLNKAIHWVESLFYAEPEVNQQPANTKQSIAKEEPKKQYSHVEVGNARACKDTSLGEVKYKKVGKVYNWVDERGIANFSSTPPKKGDFTLLNYAGEKVFDYFTLDLNTERLPYDFHRKLTLKLNKLFEVYGRLLDSSSLKKVDINLRVYASKMAFNQIKAKHNMPIGDNTPGFYSHGSNQAHLLLTNHAATMRTATHEAVHAINRGIIGYSPKWLNEGLAEYSEYIEVKGNSSRVYPNQNWTSKDFVSKQLLPLDELLTATNADWDSKLRTRLYATSWAFIYFMMDNSQRKAMLAKVIKYEQQNLCDVIGIQQVEKAMGMSIKGLKRQFVHWANRRLRTQTI
ncbi:hypothetical protein [Litorilituus sediminis]|uniref:DUF1570 domain-containing protein n=1 Tax=Litorilituus sediminis TaxID=718192 RepID=A0A4P6P2M8_9GAMM|nr:hypothetical protein [Litorilituus sediminis]QBG35551.1 hypothetical protein EMK97_07395 [Litorilituus sediminis]